MTFLAYECVGIVGEPVRPIGDTAKGELDEV